ncbi:sigma-70 family RNA polymerase sigma factor [soil metagenome]
MTSDKTEWSAQSVELGRLLGRSGLGDKAAFADLYSRTSPHLFAVVLRICQNRAQAEDVLQEVYVNVWRAAQSFDAAQSQPMTWLTSVARNRAIDSLRRKQTEPQQQTAYTAGDDGDEDMIDDLADDAPGPLEQLSQASDARALADCVQTLTPSQRQSLALAFYNGMTHLEVAERMGEPLGTVKSWVRRALGALKECLERAASSRPATRN